MSDRDATQQLEMQIRLDRLCDEVEAGLKAGQVPELDGLLVRLDSEVWPQFLRQLLEVMHQLIPDLTAEQALQLLATQDDRARREVEQAVAEFQAPRAPFARSERGLSADPTADELGELEPSDPAPQQVDHFHIVRELGAGGFGRVYLARDGMLKREVVLKLPRRDKFPNRQSLEGFLEEARKVAKLEHPGIVAVHHVGEYFGRPYIVQQFIPGGDLSKSMQRRTYSPMEAAELIASVGEAIAYAHQKRIVHRDLKPANILLDETGRPRVADFGLALHESQQERAAGEIAGTLKYMSPEQVRGETHRLDGRSDIWALGILLYRLLVGETPFRAANLTEIREQILHHPPRPPRQLKPEIPAELERICLRCLAKKMHERYSTAVDLAIDLRDWLRGRVPTADAAPGLDRRPSAQSDPQILAGPGQREPLAVIPKGLLAFDGRDQRFFLNLIPGPRDRLGNPEQVRFWKVRLEESDAAETFAVGLIFGPSGCGKSSLVRAGILPRLAPQVRTVYVEATQADTEVRLLAGLRKHFPEIPRDLALPTIFSRLRQGHWLAAGEKVVFVLDQFEQWLHANDIHITNQLVEALRHCDGSTVQALILARDDFWMAISRFFQELEIPLNEQRNFAAVDLFDREHARKVLLLFGQAYGRLPVEHPLAADQEKFLDEAVRQLAEQDLVICVRLVLFAETVKSRPWTIEMLKQLGNVSQIGTLFLEQTFEGRTSNPALRSHAANYRKILQSLLPDAGTNLKGHFRSLDELASELQMRPEAPEFRQLIEILDGQLRLITPTEPNLGIVAGEASLTHYPRHYQLTHDFLVPSIRDWIYRKEQETASGRTRLRLVSLAQEWRQAREARFMPSVAEFFSIARYVRGWQLSPGEREYFQAASIHYGWRAGLLALMLLLGIVGFWTIRSQQRRQICETRIEQLMTVGPDAVPAILDAMRPDRSLAIRLIRLREGDSNRGETSSIHLQMALAALTEEIAEIEKLIGRFPQLPNAELPNLLRACRSQTSAASQQLAAVLERTGDPMERARLCLVLFHLGDDREFSQVLKHEELAPQRLALIQLIGDSSLPLSPYLDWLTLRQATVSEHDWLESLVKAFGLIDPARLVPRDRERIVTLLGDLFRKSPSGPMHSACDRVLRRLATESDAPSSEIISETLPEANWLHTANGLHLIRVTRPEVEPARVTELRQQFGWGSPSSAPAFWMADQEIPMRLYAKFARDTGDQVWLGKFPEAEFAQIEDLPATAMTAYDAIAFCNWLSIQESLEPCYEMTDEPLEISAELRKNWVENPELHEARFLNLNQWTYVPGKSGYRLPTFAEQHVIRFQSAKTCFPEEFNQSWVQLSRYENYDAPEFRDHLGLVSCRSRLPNRMGFFDAAANVSEFALPSLAPKVPALVPVTKGDASSQFSWVAPSIVFQNELFQSGDRLGFRVVCNRKLDAE